MIKNWLAILLCHLGLGLTLQAQPPASPPKVKVLHVTGKATLVGSGATIVKDMEILTKEKIAFADLGGKIVAWDPVIGLVALEPSNDAIKKTIVLQGTVAGFEKKLVPTASNARLQSFANCQQLEAHFQGRKYLLLDKSWLLAPLHLQGKSDTVLIVKFGNNKEDYQFGRALACSNDTLFLDPAKIFDVNGKAAKPKDCSNFSLWWIQKSTNANKRLATFEMVVADEPTLHSEILNLLILMKDKSEVEKLAAARSYMQQTWGDPDTHNFDAWMALHFPKLDVGGPEPKDGEE